MDGLILVHKPEKITSHDVVDRIRNILGIKKVGHFGTLDPLATGLIIIAVGKATRLFPFYLKTKKCYSAQIKMGQATDTYDRTGQPLSTAKPKLPGLEEILRVIQNFKGEFLQIPPPFSAKKYKGKPLYAMARKNEKVELKPSPVHIYRFEIKHYNPPHLETLIECSSGTYIRSLAHDMGQMLGCGAHLNRLLRTQIGPYALEDSFFLEKIEELFRQHKENEFLIPVETLLPEYPKIVLSESGARLARNGSQIFPENILNAFGLGDTAGDDKDRETLFRLFSPEGKLLAFARRGPDQKGLHPFLVVDSGN